jgi:sugar (pentulose or hexulose) kinase
MASATVPGYLGIDNGTQGLSVVFTDESLHVVCKGEGSYEMVPNLAEGCYEQSTADWDKALEEAMLQIREQLPNLQVLAIGISGQMHGEVLCDDVGNSIRTVRLWCDHRNGPEGSEMTKLFQTKVPKRSTTARFLWTIRNQKEIAQKTRHMTTPAGWTAFRLTGEWNLGIGDAAGMFPIDQSTLDYNEDFLKAFDQKVVDDSSMASLRDILPKVKCAGEDAGSVNDVGAKLLGLPTAIGIPVAAAEGDQVAALAGSLIGRAGMVSCCFGTSVCANSVGHKNFQGVSDAVDQFCAHDGKPINMVFLRNGTTFMNSIVESYGGFASVMPELVKAPMDCGGLLAMPFMDDEPGLQVTQGGTAMIIGWNPENAKAGNSAKAALLSTMFNLKRGSSVLDRQGYPRDHLILSGGLVKTPECGQILADVFDNPVTLLESADEGCSWGAAVMAKYRHLVQGGYKENWETFLETVEPKGRQRFDPNPAAVPVYQKMYERYTKLIALQPLLNQAVSR